MARTDDLSFTLDKLSSRGDVSLNVIADEAGVGRSWIRMFARGEIPKPGYEPVTKLAEFLRSAKYTRMTRGSQQPAEPQQQPEAPRGEAAA